MKSPNRSAVILSQIVWLLVSVSLTLAFADDTTNSSVRLAIYSPQGPAGNVLQSFRDPDTSLFLFEVFPPAGSDVSLRFVTEITIGDETVTIGEFTAPFCSESFVVGIRVEFRSSVTIFPFFAGANCLVRGPDVAMPDYKTLARYSIREDQQTVAIGGIAEIANYELRGFLIEPATVSHKVVVYSSK